MNIDWQDIYYMIATFTMVVVIVVFVWLIRILYSISKLLTTLVATTKQLGSGIEEIKDMGKNIILGILGKVRNILDKGGENEQ